MALVELLMPKMGESVMEATVLGWLKNIGDTVAQDESVLEVATDKVDTEIPSTHAGVLKEILVQEGQVVQVGRPIAVISTGGDDDNTPQTSSQTTQQPEPIEEATVIEAEIASMSAGFSLLSEPAQGRFYSPLVLSIAKEENISMKELELIPGTGQEGRVTKNDIFAYLEHKKQQGKPTTSNGQQTSQEPKTEPVKQQPQPAIEQPKKEQQEATIEPQVNIPVSTPKPVSSPALALNSGDEIIEMDRMRKMIAQRMVESVHVAPHVTSFVEADVTNLVYWRSKVKQQVYQKEGEALTFMPMFVEAVAKAIKEFPMINVSVDGDKIIKRKSINIGMAVALPSGNLIVPVIHNADQLNLIGLTKRINDLAVRAREGKLKPDELAGGTYTVSNVGSFGNVMGTPILMQPQVGILALGAIRKKPAVIETPFGDTLGIRSMMYLSHSYDHRVVDGALGGMFVRRVADFLEEFDINRTIF